MHPSGQSAVKTAASKAPGTPARSSDLRSEKAQSGERSPEAQPLPAPTRAEGSLLDQLVAGGDLPDAWAAATASDALPLPARASLEQRFGSSLGHVEVHVGERATSLLDRLGAIGAARGHQILLRDVRDADTAAHEVAHVLQASSGEGPTHVLAAAHAAELEAETLALAFQRHRRLRVRRRIPRSVIALRRRDPARGALPPLESEELSPPQPAEEERARSGPERPRASEGESMGEREPGDTRAREQPTERGAEQAPREVEPAAEAVAEVESANAERDATSEGEAREGELPAGERVLRASPDRRRELSELLTQQQQNWDEGAALAEEHEVECCPQNRNGEGKHPFARGPPLEVPATQQAPDLTNPALEEPSREALARASEALGRELDRVPARGVAVNKSSLDPEIDAQRRAEQARVRREVDAALGSRTIEARASPTVSLQGEADITARTRAASQKARSAAQREQSSARERTAQDFGEHTLTPAADPTVGHDTELSQLEVPAVDLEAEVDEAARARIVSEQTAGQLPLEQVVVPRDEAMAELRATAADRAARRTQIDGEIARSDEAFTRICREGRRARDGAQANTERVVGERRERWRQAIDEHVGERQRAADQLVRDKGAHAEQLAEQADTRANDTIESAQRDARTQRTELGERAHEKAEESEDRSWWQRGLEWVSARLRELVSWIDDFIARASRAIDAMLDRASELAHGFVADGQRAISATLTLAHRGVDAIADNLPGELGRIARDQREQIHDLLDVAQQTADRWATDLHQEIDQGVELLRENLQQGLEDFRDGVHDVADGANTMLDVSQGGLLALLRRFFPALASLVDEGLLGPINRAGEQLESWARQALEGGGLASVTDTLNELHATRFCQEQSEAEQAADCAAFEARLSALRESFEALLASPIAQQIQGILQASQDQQRGQQLDAASGFFSFIQQVAEPVYRWWRSVEPQVSAALDFFGEMASAAFRELALALGLDPNLPPLEAIRQGLERAWEAMRAALQPLIDQVKQAYRWLTEESPLASIIAFFRAIPAAVSALGALLGEIAASAGDWIARAAERLKNTIMPVVERALGGASRALDAVVNRVVSWADRLLGVLDSLLSWEPAHVLLQALMQFVRAWSAPIRAAFQLFRDCGERALRKLAEVIGNLREYARTIADVATGIVQAILFFPAGAAAFLLGNTWRFLVPPCYKAPIIDFLLDLAIRFVQFLPEPADFLWAAIHQGLLGFLQGLRAAPEPQKVAAIDLLASILGGNAEVAAGFAVGLLEGVWEATGGTIMMLLQIVGFLLTLPGRLAQWGLGLLRGQGPGRGLTGADDTADVDDTADAADEGEVAAQPEREEVAPEPHALRSARAPPGVGAEPSEGTERALRRGLRHGSADRESESAAESIRPENESELASESAADELGEPAEAREDDALATPLEEGADTSALEQAGVDAEQQAEEREAGAPAQGEAAQADVDPERPPTTPDALSNLQGTLQQLLTTGFTRADVQQALDGVRDMLRQFIGQLARQAAAQLLASLSASGAGFAIGRALGTVAGQLLVDVVIAVFTGGAGTALSGARVALRGAATTGRLAGTLQRIRHAAQPLLDAIGRIRSALGQVMGRIRAWIDDVLRWMRGVGRRVRSRVQQLRRGRGRRPRTRRHQRRRRRQRDRDRDRARNRRRLERARRELPAKIARFTRRPKSRTLFRAQLWIWKRQYRLTRLSLQRHRVYARVNPGAYIDDLDQVDPGEIGRHLEPLLIEAERRFLRQLERNRTRGAQSRWRQAVAAVESRRTDPLNLPVPEQVRLLRQLRRGEIVPRHPGGTRAADPRWWQTLRPGHDRRATLSIRNRGNVAEFFQLGAPRYEEALSGERSLDTPSGQALVGVLEPARMEGNLVTRSVAQYLPAINPNVSALEVNAGRFNPLAPLGGGRGADQDTFEGPERPTAAGRGEVDVARRERLRRVGLVFQELRRILRNESTPALTKEERRALRELADRFQRWLRVQCPDGGDPDAVRLERETRRMTRALRAWLRFIF